MSVETNPMLSRASLATAFIIAVLAGAVAGTNADTYSSQARTNREAGIKTHRSVPAISSSPPWIQRHRQLVSGDDMG
jgi:hypothetical protein